MSFSQLAKRHKRGIDADFFSDCFYATMAEPVFALMPSEHYLGLSHLLTFRENGRKAPSIAD